MSMELNKHKQRKLWNWPDQVQVLARDSDCASSSQTSSLNSAMNKISYEWKAASVVDI